MSRVFLENATPPRIIEIIERIMRIFAQNTTNEKAAKLVRRRRIRRIRTQISEIIEMMRLYFPKENRFLTVTTSPQKGHCFTVSAIGDWQCEQSIVSQYDGNH